MIIYIIFIFSGLYRNIRQLKPNQDDNIFRWQIVDVLLIFTSLNFYDKTLCQ